jgi:predicted ATPase
MLTRLRIQGFKSLSDVEVRFGPFTCIAGANGAGKSNLFDAIMFLHDLADHTIVEAAYRVRDRSGAAKGDLASLFTRSFDDAASLMTLEADFIVSREVVDDFGRRATPSSSFLNYKIKLRHVSSDEKTERVELVYEELTYIPKSQIKRRLGFGVSREFMSSAFFGERRAKYISTDIENGKSVIKVSQDGVAGRPSQVPAEHSPRTILGSANTDERPTVLAARREMQAWRLLQLEPARLRAPDEFSDVPNITYDGAHIPSTLERIGRYEEISNRVATLLPEVRSIGVDIDNTRRLKTLTLEQRNGLIHRARSMSDGTLRFVALATMSFDPQATGLICLEEPENGIHPSRIPAILDLLKDMVTDTDDNVGVDNPLRQVVVNTHSPLVVQRLVPDDLLIAVPMHSRGSTFTAFGAMENSWRIQNQERVDTALTPRVSLSELLDYLNSRDASTISSDGLPNTLWQLAATQGVLELV